MDLQSSNKCQLLSEKEVFAQVKLSFRNTKGDKMVLTRNSSLTVKKTTRQFKTLEASLLQFKDGERTSVSSRVAQLDQLIPHFLGISKAILDSVIFCHQDESLWPMSDSNTLKKRFDEIFEAQKYTKAIDNIKKLKKDQGEALKRLKLTEQYSRSIKDKGDKAEKQAKGLDAELVELRAEIADFQKKDKNADEKAREAWEHATRFSHDVETLKLKREKQDWNESNIEKKSKTMKKRPESDEWLQSEFDQFGDRMAQRNMDVEQQTKQYKEVGRQIDADRKRLRDKYGESGKYEQQKTNYEQQLESREVLIKESARRHAIRGFETDLDEIQINEYQDKVARLSREQNAAVEKARRETEKEKLQVRETLSQLKENKFILIENKKSAKQQSAANDQASKILKTKLNDITIDEAEKAIIQNKIHAIDSQLQSLKDETNKASWDNQIYENRSQAIAKDEEYQRLQQELFEAIRQAGDLASLDHLKKERADRQRGLEQMTAVHRDKIDLVVGSGWEPSTVEDAMRKIIEQRDHHVKDAGRQRDVVARALEQIDYKLGSARRDQKKAEKELDTCGSRLNETFDGEPERYLDNLSELQEARDVLKADFVGFQSFEEGIKTAQAKHRCSLCARPFHGEEEQSFITRMKKKMGKDLAATKKDLEDTEEELRKAKEAGPIYETWTRLSGTELPRLHKGVKSLGIEREKALSELETHDRTVQDREDSRRDVEAISNPVAKIVKSYQEMVKFSNEIEEMNAKQKDAVGTRSSDDIKSEMEAVGSSSRDLRKKVDRLAAEKERVRAQLSSTELEQQKFTNSLSNVDHQLEKKFSLTNEIERLRSASRSKQDDLRLFDQQLQELLPQITEEDAKLEDIERRGSEKEDSLQLQASTLASTVTELTLANQNIRKYIDNGGPANLARCQREVEAVQREIEHGEYEQRLMTVSINKIKEEVHNHERTKQVILENIEYRQNLRDLQTIKADIAELTAKNAEADQSHWQREASHWTRLHNEFSMQKTSKLGIAKVKDDQLETLLNEWEMEYKDAAFNYKKAHIEVETTKAAVEDLGRYGGALDKAIMKYHSIKMEEINRIIEELWKKTYQGTDVDTILIRSDHEAAKGNRTYNYRVCMIKQDAEMDMRGRCSAGQKVLASIIIRLALAECFGVSCGLIALDEPTTNLDRDNIRSLAQSLHDIIETRRHQSNFQLIVITHDEEFLKFMKCPDFCDKYYRVSRNNRQNSQIDMQSISEVM
ncbi:DNA repair protein rad50 [Puttea exsequens]|nr:DNA repair protein rad50 [Puttea exsequens]